MLPSSIKPGDTIGVIAPAIIILEKDEKYIEKSTKLFEDLGYKIKFGKYVRANTLGYGATAKQKAEDINNMFADKDVKDLFYNKFKDLEGIDEIIIHNKENNKYYIDTARINKQTLLNAGLKEENIIDSNICTVCDSDICHSFRAEKELSGRAVTMIELISEDKYVTK